MRKLLLSSGDPVLYAVQFCYLLGKYVEFTAPNGAGAKPQTVSAPGIRGYITCEPFSTLAKWFLWPLNYLLNCNLCCHSVSEWKLFAGISEMWKISPIYFSLKISPIYFGSRWQSPEYGCSFIQTSKMELSLCIDIGLKGYPEWPLGQKQDLEKRVKGRHWFYLCRLKFSQWKCIWMLFL